MFELLSADRRPSPHRAVPFLIATTAHVIAVGAVVAASLVYVRAELPEPPHAIAFIVASPPPAAPPPPPPPPPPAATATPTPKTVVPVRATSRPAPVVAPPTIAAEAPVENVDNVDSEDGVPGGIEGGVPGGVIGGVIGGLVPIDVPPPPPPPPPRVVERGPVRVGGAITAPALIERVEPEYPQVAVNARVEGVVILEATVGRDGRVEDVRVLRSLPLLDRAAMYAVRQWRYSPLLLNETPERFVLTVTVSFSLGT